MPIRWRLAGGSALLTLVILLGFAAVVGTLTTNRIRADYNRQVEEAASDLQGRPFLRVIRGRLTCAFNLDAYAGAQRAAIRLVRPGGEVLCQTAGAPRLEPPRGRTVQSRGYRVASRPVRLGPDNGTAFVQYARSTRDVENTIATVRVLLALGVVTGALLALLAGLAVARRAMRPIAQLTDAAREIQRTRDPGLELPRPAADDEVAKLARTLEAMLGALDDARSETELSLAHQRAFVADASHELRTPLTSVLVNLELLADELDAGELRDAATSALRSSRRMRRLVADLLLLARMDTGRHGDEEPVDLAEVLAEVAAELAPLATQHELAVSATAAEVHGVRDELHRLMLNLIENAIAHTPAGGGIRATAGRVGGQVVLAVEDDGPGVPADLAPRIFDRFVRGASDTGSSTGLGLAIVRAVAEAHRGTAELEPGAPGAGARFVVSLPARLPEGLGDQGLQPRSNPSVSSASDR